MSATKLLVLGIVHLSGGAHGYQVRTELLSWHAESWARIRPGSIYHALKKAARDGLLEEAVEPGTAGPERTLYRITDAGLAAAEDLVRTGLRTTGDPFLAPAAVAMVGLLGRAEVIELLGERIQALEADLAGLDEWQNTDDPDEPEHVAELALLWEGGVKAEMAWAQAFIDRLKDGTYQLAGD